MKRKKSCRIPTTVWAGGSLIVSRPREDTIRYSIISPARAKLSLRALRKVRNFVVPAGRKSVFIIPAEPPAVLSCPPRRAVDAPGLSKRLRPPPFTFAAAPEGLEMEAARAALRAPLIFVTNPKMTLWAARRSDYPDGSETVCSDLMMCSKIFCGPWALRGLLT
jgi:hypothetical protein